MFDNLGWWEIGALIIVAMLIFGPEKLPQIVADAMRLLRRLRSMARDASGDLKEHLGPDVEVEDLHPKRFVRKHLLSAEDEELLRKPFSEIDGELRGVKTDLSNPLALAGRSAPPFDPEAT